MAFATPLSVEQDFESPSHETEDTSAAHASPEVRVDPVVQRLFRRAPAEPPDSAAGSLSVQRLKVPVLQRAQRLYGNHVTEQMVIRTRTLQRQCACGGT